MRRAQASPHRFALVVAALFALLALSELPVMSGPLGLAREAMSGPELLAANAVGGVEAAVSVLGEVAALRADNQRLQAQAAALQARVDQLSAAGAENGQLRQALNFERSFKGRLLAAQVVGSGPAGRDSWLRIDQGSAQGVRAGMVVVTGAGLVGLVSQVMSSSATVQTLADPNLRVNVYTAQSNLDGTLYGGSGKLALDLIPSPGVVAKKGEGVLTSGVGNLFPRGLVVGQLASFDNQPAAISEQATVASANQLSQVSMVLVMIKAAGS